MPRPKQELMRVKPPVEFTEERKEMFIEHLRETGFMVHSAEYAGVVPRTVNYHREKDKEFDAAVQAALDFNTERDIEAALKRRGIEGWQEPVIGGKDRDIVVTTVTKYSDACLLTLARSRQSRFNQGAKETEGDGAGGGVGGRGGGLLIVPFPPPSKEEWEALYGEAARGTTGSPA